MKRFLLSSMLTLVTVGQMCGRTWTDVKGRKIVAEYVSQSEDAVVLKLKGGKEVTVAIKNLSREDLSHLIELEIEEAKKSKPEEAPKDHKMKDEEAEEPKPAGGADVPAAEWTRPILRQAVLPAPLETQAEKNGDLNHYSSANFRVVADSRLKSRSAKTILESCELTRIYCESLPFGLKSRYEPINGKYEIHTIAKDEDWIKAGYQEKTRASYDPATGKINICLENFGLSSGGSGSEDRMRSLSGQMIRHYTGAMMPQVYDRNLTDWFKEGFANLINCAVYEKSFFDYKEVIEEAKDLLLGKSRSGAKPLFKKEIEMPHVSDLLITSTNGVADEEARRRFLGHSLIVMTYLVYMDEEGKANGLRDGLRYMADFQKNLPERITAATQEELDQKVAELKKKQQEMGDDATQKIFRGRPWIEVEADIAKQWKLHGLKLVFPGAKEE